MNKEKLTILLTVILIISLGVVGSFWYQNKKENIRSSENDKSIFVKDVSKIRLFLIRDCIGDVRGNDKADEVVTHINTDSWITYENKDVGIKFKHPKGLKIIVTTINKENFPRVIHINFLNEYDKNQQSEDDFYATLDIYKYSKNYGGILRELGEYEQYCLERIRGECVKIEGIQGKFIVGKERGSYESGDSHGSFDGYYINNQQKYNISLFMLNYVDRFIWFTVFNSLIINE